MSEPSPLPAIDQPLSTSQRVLITLILLAFVAVSWSGILERTAQDRLTLTLERALVTAAVARGLNGVISVAQGTEIAVQPVGVGVTITAGEILDPLNDLVERFSWLALVASASLGTQLLLTEIFTETLVSVVLTAVVCVYLVFLWSPRQLPGARLVLRAAALLIFVRFMFTIIALCVSWVDGWVLEARQQVAMTELTHTSQEIDALNNEPLSVPSEPSIRQRFESLLDESRQLLDVESQLSALQSRVESSVGHMLELTALFLVQTVLVPLAAFWLSLAAFRWFWGWLKDP